MSDAAELKALLSQLVQNSKEQQDRFEKEKAEQAAALLEVQTKADEKFATLIASIQQPGPITVRAPDPDADAVRADKIQKVNVNMRRSQRFKPYKVSTDTDIKLFLKKFDEELTNVKSLVGLAGEDLKKEEFVPIFRSCLDYSVVERVDQVLKGQSKKWEDLTEADLLKLMKDEFGEKQTEVARVISMFGAQRLTKSPNEKVSEFYFKFLQNIPESMKPSTEQGRKDFVDLIHRSMFYISLDDEYIQKALSDLKDDAPTLKKYFDEAQAAECRRSSYKDIAKTCTTTDSNGITISKWDTSQKKGSNTPSVRNKDFKNAKFGGKTQNKQNFSNQNQNDQKQNASKQNSSKQNEQNQNSQNSNQNHDKTNKKNMKYCKLHKQNFTHVTKDCRQLQKSNLKKLEKNDSDTEDNELQHCTFHSIEAVNPFTPTVKSFASVDDDHPLVTSEPLLTYLNLEGIARYPFEIDTAASHNIISEKYFNMLQKQLEKRGSPIIGNGPSKMLPRPVKIKLADGNMAGQQCPVVQINVSTDIFKFTNNMPLTFLVVKGPNCLIGRHSLAKMWPTEFKMFKQSTCENKKVYDNLKICAKKVTTQLASDCSHKNVDHASSEPSINKVSTISKLKTVKNSNQKANKQQFQNDNSKPVSSSKPQITQQSSKQDKFIKDTTKAVQKSNNASQKSQTKSKAKSQSEDASISRANLKARENEPPASLPTLRNQDQTGFDPGNAAAAATDSKWPARRELPQLPDGPISEEMGREYCLELCEVYHEVFDGSKGCFKDASATLELKPGGYEAIKKSGLRPTCKRPYGLEVQFDEKLDKLYDDLEPIDGKDLFTASQIVPVIDTNKNGERIIKRLAINYKSTINQYIEDVPDIYTTCVDELAKVAGEFRTTVDLEGAFKQVPVDDMLSRKLMAVVTPWGYGIPKCLMFGVKCAPAIFNSNMRKLLHACNGRGPVKCAQMVDDVCLSGKNAKEHFENLAELLYRLYACGLKVNKEKCSFYQREVKFLGKICDERGVRLDPATTNAILGMPTPADKSQLRSFLGHISYISRHIPDLKSARAPLDKLIKPDIQFAWKTEHENAFLKCKKLASNPALLTHFDPAKPLVLTTDASPYGVGACLSHKVVIDNKTRLLPIAYASASLKASQCNYSQIDREGLGVYWGVNYFRQYLLCKEFELHTDCSALTKIFGPHNDLKGCAAGRLSRWAIALMEYSFTVKHIKGTSNCTADSLSRLPVVDKNSISAPFPNVQNATNMNLPQSIKLVESDLIIDVKYLSFNPISEETSCTVNQVVGDNSTLAAWDLVPLNIKEVAAATKTCKVYGKLYRAVKSGKFDAKDKDLSKFAGVFDSLYIESDIIHFGNRIWIPPVYHDRLLTELHSTHIGVISMKRAIRDLFWWPGISKAIENIAAQCSGCKKYKKKPSKNTLSVWPFARRPMERVHVDYFEYKSKHVLIMVDAFSKKIWCHYLGTDTTAKTTCAALFNWFCSESGHPTTLVSDNGPQFTSGLFADKMKIWGIKHIFSPPYHPCSNGAAERAVQLVKDRLKKMDVSSKAIDLYVSLAYITKVHGLTPHSSTDRCPFELIKMGGLPSLFPSLTSDPTQKAELTVTRHCAGKLKKRRSFDEGDLVTVYDNFNKISYDAVVSEVLGTNNYIVISDNGDKHVSGDNMSARAPPSPADVPLAPAAAVTVDNIDSNSVIDDDNLSTISDISDDLDLPTTPFYYNHNNEDAINDPVIPARRGMRELNNLLPPQANTRLRSGRN